MLGGADRQHEHAVEPERHAGAIGQPRIQRRQQVSIERERGQAARRARLLIRGEAQALLGARW